MQAARNCRAWGEATAYNRSQVLAYFTENLWARSDEFAARLAELTGVRRSAARHEVDAAVERLFEHAGQADKFEGRVHQPPARAVTLALNEPVGVIGIVAPDEAPLLSLISLLAPALAMGNTVVAVPSELHALIATDLYQVIETSDFPAGAINIVTGRAAELAAVLARHDDVDGLLVHRRSGHLPAGGSRIGRQSEARLNRRRPHGRLERRTLGARGLAPARGRDQKRMGAVRRLDHPHRR